MDEAVLFPNGGDEVAPRLLRDRLGLFHPTDVHALEGFEVSRVQPNALECKRGAIGTSDLTLENFIEMRKPHLADLIHQQLMHGLLDGFLHLTSAQNAERALVAQEQESTGEVPALRTSAPALVDFKSERLKEWLELLWEGEINGGSGLVSGLHVGHTYSSGLVAPTAAANRLSRFSIIGTRIRAEKSSKVIDSATLSGLVCRYRNL